MGDGVSVREGHGGGSGQISGFLDGVAAQGGLPHAVCAPWVLSSGPSGASPVRSGSVTQLGGMLGLSLRLTLLGSCSLWRVCCCVPFWLGCSPPGLHHLSPDRSELPRAPALLLSQNLTLPPNNRAPLLLPRPRGRWESGQKRGRGGERENTCHVG